MIRSSTRTEDSNRRTLVGNEKVEIKNDKFKGKFGFWQENHLFKASDGILTHYDF
jgi:hypothetical protein